VADGADAVPAPALDPAALARTVRADPA
jgi:hypothetical protein